MTITRKPLARSGSLTAKAISMINAGKPRVEIVKELGLKNDFTYYRALRLIRERRKEYYANKVNGNGQPETSGNPANVNPTVNVGGPLRYELHIVDHKGNVAKFFSDKASGLKQMFMLLARGDE